MLLKTMVALAFATEMLLCGAAFAIEQCPVNDSNLTGSYFEAVKSAVQNAPNCQRAFRIAEGCQFGDSKTNQLLEIVESKCEPLFMTRTGSATEKAYKKAQARCDSIAKQNPGTMYQSFAAVCRAGATADLARKYGPRKR